MEAVRAYARGELPPIDIGLASDYFVEHFHVDAKTLLKSTACEIEDLLRVNRRRWQKMKSHCESGPAEKPVHRVQAEAWMESVMVCGCASCGLGHGQTAAEAMAAAATADGMLQHADETGEHAADGPLAEFAGNEERSSVNIMGGCPEEDSEGRPGSSLEEDRELDAAVAAAPVGAEAAKSAQDIVSPPPLPKHHQSSI
jgi:hypothetical protein